MIVFYSRKKQRLKAEWTLDTPLTSFEKQSYAPLVPDQIIAINL